MVKGDWNPYVSKDKIYPHSKGMGIKYRKMDDVNYLIIHTTGSGYLKKVGKDYDKGELWLAKYYSKNYSSHYMIGKGGDMYQFIKDCYVAPHTGMSKEARRIYWGKDDWKRHIWDTLGGTGHHKHTKALKEYDGYLKRWGDDFIPPMKYPNQQSIGIDLQGGGEFTERQYMTLAKLIIKLCKKYDIAMDHRHIVGHEDAHPMVRTRYYKGRKEGKGGWDPGHNFDWSNLFTHIYRFNQSNFM